MSRPPSRLPDDLPGPIFTVSEALEAGLRRGRLQSSDLIRLRRGLVARTDRTLTPADVCRAQMRTHEDTVAVGETAARLWGMPLPSRVPDFPVRLSSPPNVRRRDDAIVSWSRRRIDQAAVIVVHGVRLLDRPATWASLGATLPLEDLVIIADHLLREPRPHYDSGRTTPYATRAQLAAAIDRSPRTGRPRLREALDRARVGADSPMETRLRLLLAREGFRSRYSTGRCWPSTVGLSARSIGSRMVNGGRHRICSGRPNGSRWSMTATITSHASRRIVTCGVGNGSGGSGGWTWS